MAYNFKSIADVEVVEKPVDTANVLIEENGVVKKAPKSAVGVNTFVVYVDDINYSDGIPAPDGLYEALQNMFDNHVYVEVILYHINENELYDWRINDGMWRNNDGSFETWTNDSTRNIRIYPNGTMSVCYMD